MAMILGKSYEEIDQDFIQSFDSRGLTSKEIIKYLAFCGRQIIRKEVEYFNQVKFGRDELLKPFAPAHIVTIRQCFDSKDTHAVFMDETGKIYCPSEIGEDEIKNAYSIDEVIGVYK